jgi:hypothetical protein
VAAAAKVDTALAAAGGGHRSGRLRGLREALSTVADSILTPGDVAYPRPMLVDQLDYLYGLDTSADQRPGSDAATRLQTLTARTERYARRLGELEDRVRELAGG